eukprot:COSAG02_NODE_13748_length_1354_cov_1.556972_1_plen_25_part_10
MLLTTKYYPVIGLFPLEREKNMQSR